MGNFPKMRASIINRLSALHYHRSSFATTDRVIIGRECGVLEWFLEGVITIAVDFDTDITLPDARKLGVDTAILLYHLKGKTRDFAAHNVEQQQSGQLSGDQRDVFLKTLSIGISECFHEDVTDIVARGGDSSDSLNASASHRTYRWREQKIALAGYEAFSFKCLIGEQSKIILQDDPPLVTVE
ncbi:hypothetical protein PM082_019735 [Marasmius tenuissimus]|nr:hypothetical protein PM082_019735 [Marasmius tenuissimus]